MDIVIIAEFCETFSDEDNGRFLYLANMLSNEHDVELVTSSFYHTTKSQRTAPERSWPFDITFISEPGYPKNICLKRFYSHAMWGRNVEKYLRQRKRPDVIYCAIPSLTGPNLIAKYCEKNNIRFVIDVQDLWPEAFKMVFNVPVVSGIVFAPFSVLANGIYKRADAICGVSDTYCSRALRVNKKCAKSATVFLGTDLTTFDAYARAKPIRTKPNDEVWLAYCGTLGSSYDLTCVIDALNLLDDERVKFIVMGDGPKMDEFRGYSEQKHTKTWFVGRLQYDQMCSLLSSCDITVNPIVHGAAGSIINKHADYAASGLPVINTQESEEYRKLVDEYNMGFNCENGSSSDVAVKLRMLIDNVKLCRKMGANARRCAEERFDRVTSYNRLVEEIVLKEARL